MVDSWDDNNYLPSKLEQSLRKIIAQLEQSLDHINNNSSSSDISFSNTKLIRNLERNSELLLRYLSDDDQLTSFTSASEFRSLPSNKQFDYSNSKNNDKEFLSSANVKQNNFRSHKSPSRKFNLALAIALIISLLFNLYSFFWTNNLPKIETINSSQETSTLLNNSDNQTDEKLLDNSSEIVAPPPEMIEPDSLKPEIPQDDTAVEVPDSIAEKDSQLKSAKENNLLNIIKHKLQIITDSYHENLIVKVVPRYENNSILIVVNDNWQQLELEERKELSQKLFEQTKSIDFYRFQLKDIHKNLLSRNSVFGDNLIFYQ